MDLERYRHPALRQLAEQQVRFAPVSVRLQQLERTEQFLLTVQSQSVIRYAELFREITSRRTTLYPDLEIAADDVLRDLGCFVEDLSESLQLDSAASPEPVWTQAEIGRHLNVSVKTITRWRERGLAGRRYRFGSRKRIGFLKSYVERFVEAHRDAVARGSRFRLMSDSEREWIIRRGRRLARLGASLTEVVKRLSRRTGRAPETIRYTIKAHDREHPHAAVFPKALPAMTDADRQEIFLALKRGISPTRLAQQYRRTRSSIYRIAKEYRAELLSRQTIDYIESEEFSEPDVDELLLQAPPEIELPGAIEIGSELPAYLADLYAFPVLTREQEYFLFRKMNYLKFKAARIRDHLPKSRRKVADMDEIDRLLESSLGVKNLLIRCNLRLVVSVARKHKKPSSHFFELISDGNMTLIRAIEKFDFTRGNKFSTYATWALMRSYARSVPAEDHRLDRFRTGTEEVITLSQDDRMSIGEEEGRAFQQRQMIESILDQLNEREQEAISLRFALRGHAEPLTLEQIGERLGVSKERTRQIISAGLEKLRRIAQRDQFLDEPEE